MATATPLTSTTHPAPIAPAPAPAGMQLPPATPPRRKPRVEFIDLTRGLLFTLMTSSHAITMTNVPEGQFFNSKWWLPRFWATLCFIILSGFSVAFLFDWRNNAAVAAAKMRRRAWQLLIVMFFSNIIMLVLSMVARRDLSELRTAAWWVGLLTFKTDYSISAILIPTALLLLACQGAAWLQRHIGLWVFLAFTFALSLGEALLSDRLKQAHVDSWFVHHFITVGIGNFEVLHLWIFGLIGFALGAVWKTLPPARQWLILAFAAVACIQIRYVWSPETFQRFHVLVHATEGPIYFLALLVSVLLAVRIKFLHAAVSVPRLIGKYALFSFIAHRIVLQCLHICYKVAFPANRPVLEYLIVFPGTIFLIWLLCLLRENGGPLDRGLKRLYL